MKLLLVSPLGWTLIVKYESAVEPEPSEQAALNE